MSDLIKKLRQDKERRNLERQYRKAYDAVNGASFITNFMRSSDNMLSPTRKINYEAYRLYNMYKAMIIKN